MCIGHLASLFVMARLGYYNTKTKYSAKFRHLAVYSQFRLISLAIGKYEWVPSLNMIFLKSNGK